MNRFILVFLLILFSISPVFTQQHKKKLGSGYEFVSNGKVTGKSFQHMYQLSKPKVKNLEFSQNLLIGAQRNLRYLTRILGNKTLQMGNLKVSVNTLKKSGLLIKDLAEKKQIELLKKFSFYQIKGEDGEGNVHFTGYFTPVLKARHKPYKRFRYPIYALPKGKKSFSRKAIDHQNVLAGQGLELGYTDDLLDNYFLSVQGSGMLDFGNGEQKYVGYAGQNGLPYRSIGKMLVSSGAIPAEKISLRTIRQWFNKHPQQMIPMLNKNPSYTYFKWKKKTIAGAAGVSLTPMHSVAVDRTCIPYGACLLAKMPVLDNKGNLIGHKWQIIFAQDTGGAIRGPGHLDLYHGSGKSAGDKAGDLHHYGRVWLMLAK